ncbi:MAG: glycosyltransferase family 1 protein [Nocardioides sp.]|uniref:glycosyltransferase family 4 protein n=1 Tax=Nocardioides sp. TaxID=35761 RepID=UPI0032678D4D
MALIAVDGRFLGTGTGLANYTRHLLEAMVEEGSHDYVVLTRPGVELNLPVKVVEADIAHYSPAEQTRLPRIVSGTGCDLAFFPHFNAPMFSPTPFVVTVHDLILHRHPGGASPAKRAIYRTLLRRNLNAARRVIAVSEWTRQDLIRHYGPRVGAKCSVSGEGAGPAFRPRDLGEIAAARSRLGLQRDFFVYAGNAKPHKNLETLVAAHRASGLDIDLVLVTGDPDATRYQGTGVVVARGVDDDGLAALYSDARAFVTASLDEGYCLPVAEALACGCPVIASECGAIPETAQGHARLVAPTVAAWTEALRSPTSDQPPISVGDWAAAGRRTLEALDLALVTRST